MRRKRNRWFARCSSNHPLSDEQVSNIKVGDSRVFDLKREPDVYARLLDDKSIIGDTETAFGMIPNICWEARRTWLLRSAKFITYLSPNLLGPNEACRIIADEDTRLEPVLQKIVEDMSVLYSRCRFRLSFGSGKGVDESFRQNCRQG